MSVRPGRNQMCYVCRGVLHPCCHRRRGTQRRFDCVHEMNQLQKLGRAVLTSENIPGILLAVIDNSLPDQLEETLKKKADLAPASPSVSSGSETDSPITAPAVVA